MQKIVPNLETFSIGSKILFASPALNPSFHKYAISFCTKCQNIKRIDEKAVINACKLVTYDVWFRNPMGAIMAKGADETNPDNATVQNIKILVQRSLKFWEDYGPIVKDGFTFEPNGYTEIVNSGDGDYLTADTIWDFKVSKSKPTNKHTLQLLMYWIMGQHSGQAIFKNIFESKNFKVGLSHNSILLAGLRIYMFYIMN